MKKQDILSAKDIAAAQRVPAYRHPESRRTAALHVGDQAYTITGLPCGQAVENEKEENAKKKVLKSAPASPATPSKKS